METTTKLELLDPAALIPSAANPRVHSQRQIRELRASLREYGVVSPVLVDQERNIIAGHAVVEAALAECVPAVPCVYVEHLTPTQRKAYMIASNRLAEKSHWDDGLLDACLQELFDAGFDLRLTGFGEYRLSDALARDAAPDLPDGGQEIDQCRRGDLWELGSHRLLCGDATRPEDMRRLMRDERAWLLLTDPPYNVDYHGGTAEHLTIANDNLPADRFQAFLTDALTAARGALMPGAAFYIWYGASSTMQIPCGLPDGKAARPRLPCMGQKPVCAGAAGLQLAARAVPCGRACACGLRRVPVRLGRAGGSPLVRRGQGRVQCVFLRQAAGERGASDDEAGGAVRAADTEQYEKGRACAGPVLRLGYGGACRRDLWPQVQGDGAVPA